MGRGRRRTTVTPAPNGTSRRSEHLGDAAPADDRHPGAGQRRAVLVGPAVGAGIAHDAPQSAQQQRQRVLPHRFGVHALAGGPTPPVVEDRGVRLDAGPRELHPVELRVLAEQGRQPVGIGRRRPHQARGGAGVGHHSPAGSHRLRELVVAPLGRQVDARSSGLTARQATDRRLPTILTAGSRSAQFALATLGPMSDVDLPSSDNSFEDAEDALLEGDRTFTPGTARAAFSHRTFRIVYFGAFASNIGTWMQNVVLGAIAYELTQLAACSSGLIIFAQLGPLLLLSIVGGLLADVVDRKKLLMILTRRAGAASPPCSRSS